MKIWQRYLFKQLLQSFFFLLFSILTIYIVIDFSIRGVKFLDHEMTFLKVTLNYLHQFSLYFDLFASIAFLLSSLKVLIDCNIHQELTALQMAGLSKKNLLFPFFILALFLTLISYANSQWFSPDAGRETNAFKTAYNPKKSKKEKVFSLNLKDNSELVYQRVDPDTMELFDVYWIKSMDDIWHMKRLTANPPTAQFAEHLVRNQQGQLEKQESFELKDFPEIIWEKEDILNQFVPFENRSLTTLGSQSFSHLNEKKSLQSHLYYKLAWGWVPLLILLAISSPSFLFSRGKSSFLLVSCSLFALVGFTTLINGMLILAENQVVDPFLAIWFPLVCTFTLAVRSFSKIF